MRRSSRPQFHVPHWFVMDGIENIVRWDNRFAPNDPIKRSDSSWASSDLETQYMQRAQRTQARFVAKLLYLVNKR